jgi:predicted metal-dependent enzyme (double-stranded beta helix superfamily)
VTETPQPDGEWPWPETLDACIAAPQSHRLLFENEHLRVLEVIVDPGTREPVHTHRAQSVMIVDRPARIRYYTGSSLTFETPVDADYAQHTSWLEPEPPHSVENIDVHPYHAYRIELRVRRG